MKKKNCEFVFLSFFFHIQKLMLNPVTYVQQTFAKEKKNLKWKYSSWNVNRANWIKCIVQDGIRDSIEWQLKYAKFLFIYFFLPNNLAFLMPFSTKHIQRMHKIHYLAEMAKSESDKRKYKMRKKEEEKDEMTWNGKWAPKQRKRRIATIYIVSCCCWPGIIPTFKHRRMFGLRIVFLFFCCLQTTGSWIFTFVITNRVDSSAYHQHSKMFFFVCFLSIYVRVRL